MKPSRFPALVFAAVLIALPVSQFVGAAPVPAPQDSGNLYKEIMDHKTIQWKTAPDAAIPPDVCTMMQACAAPAKVAVLTLTEGGQKNYPRTFSQPYGSAKGQTLARFFTVKALEIGISFWWAQTETFKKRPMSPSARNSWILMSNTLAQPTFAKDKAAWHAWVSKPAPTAAPAAKPAGGDAQ